MVVAGKLILLMLSNFGYWEYFHKRWGIDLFFAPAFTLAAQFTVLFLPGLLNFLPEASYCLYFGGLFLLARALCREKWGAVLPYLNWGYLLLGMMLLAVAFTVNNQVLAWIDNFTHWGVVVKNMLEADRFPTFAQPAVGFMDYPLGASTMIYYFCRKTGTGEGIQMLAQGYAILCMILPVFAFGKKKSGFCLAFCLVLTNLFLCYNIPITELLVDTLLPLTAGCLFLFLYWLYREKPEGQKPDRFWLAMPMLFFTMNVKSSGILFVVIALLLLLLYCKKEKADLKPVLQGTLILLIGFFLWKKHCDYVFWHAAGGQHAISVEYFQMRLAERSLADMMEIFRRVSLFVMTRKELLCLAGLLAVLALVTVWLNRDWRGRYLRMLGFSAGLYMVYSLSLAGMYMFSMGVEAALNLESIDRYIRSVDILLYLLLCAYTFALLAQSPKGKLGAQCVLLAAVIGLWGVTGNFQLVTQTRNDPQRRLAVETVLDEYGVAKGFSCLVCEKEDVTKYSAYVCRYFLDTDQVQQIRVTEPSQLENAKNYDYIIILDTENPVIESWVAEHYPEQSGKQVIQDIK